jgi:Zn-dependent M28 family amino/carboxypeptidase
MGIEVQLDPEPARNSFIRSDQYSFILHGIPALAMKDGYAKGQSGRDGFQDLAHGAISRCHGRPEAAGR